MIKIIIALVITLPISAFSQTKNCIVKGNIEDFHSSTIVSLLIKGETDTIIKLEGNNSFKINKLIAEPFHALLKIDYEGVGRKIDWVEIYLSEGTVQLNISNPENEKKIKITGPPLTVDFEEKLFQPILIYNEHVEALQEKHYRALQKHSADSTKLEYEVKSFINKCYQVPAKYIKENPSSMLCIKALEMMGSGNPNSENGINELTELFNSLSENVRGSISGKNYADKLKVLKNNDRRQ